MSIPAGGRAPGAVLARGRDATVYDLGDGRVLRRYLDPTRSTEGEARVMAHLERHAFPVPSLVDAGGPDLVLQRIDGPTLLDDLGRRPWRLARHARTLAELHQRLHRLPVPDGLRPRFGDGDALLHLDLHPGNVLVGEAGPVVIDWTSAACGPAAADEAQTWLVVATSEIPASGFRRGLLHGGRQLFIRALIARFDRATAVDLMPEVARERAGDHNVTAAERDRIERFAARVAMREGGVPRRRRAPGHRDDPGRGTGWHDA